MGRFFLGMESPDIRFQLNIWRLSMHLFTAIFVARRLSSFVLVLGSATHSEFIFPSTCQRSQSLSIYFAIFILCSSNWHHSNCLSQSIPLLISRSFILAKFIYIFRILPNQMSLAINLSFTPVSTYHFAHQLNMDGPNNFLFYIKLSEL